MEEEKMRNNLVTYILANSKVFKDSGNLPHSSLQS
ncbi:unnamed protein product [Arabidopsis thaliana]|uniref:Uncharacterized protein n=1 Tax=Arabidopsis thaliana TaxID=3702 RepID=A0A654ENV7_ARATH|nr:unnamed protein product [Arabidopsis thaliana]